MNDAKVTIEYGYGRLHHWTERQGDTLVFMCRLDKYYLDGTLKSVGEPTQSTAVLHLNGWSPPPGTCSKSPPPQSAFESSPRSLDQ